MKALPKRPFSRSVFLARAERKFSLATPQQHGGLTLATSGAFASDRNPPLAAQTPLTRPIRARNPSATLPTPEFPLYLPFSANNPQENREKYRATHNTHHSLQTRLPSLTHTVVMAAVLSATSVRRIPTLSFYRETPPNPPKIPPNSPPANIFTIFQRLFPPKHQRIAQIHPDSSQL